MENFRLDDFFGMETMMEGVKLYDKLNEEIFTLKGTGLTAKTLNDWEKESVLLSKREKAAVWRKFSFLDYLWIKTLNEFRAMGTPLNLLRNLKEGVNEKIPFKFLIGFFKANLSKFEKGTDKKTFIYLKEFVESEEARQVTDKEGLSVFLLMVIESLTIKAPVSLILFSDGKWLIWNENKSDYRKEVIEKLTFETHTTVSLSKVIKSFLYSDTSNFVLPKLSILQENELKLLEIINSGDYESITINFKNKKMKSLEMIKEQDVKKKVVDIISENQYQDIVIKSHKGIVTKIQNTVKVMLD